MKIRWIAIIIGASAVVVLGVPGFAHHGAAGLFDESRVVEISGSVVEWSFVNPHPVLILSVADEHGQNAEWDIYFGPSAATAMGRRGFSADTFARGEFVTVQGHPANAEGVRAIDVFGASGVVTRADGSSIP